MLPVDGFMADSWWSVAVCSMLVLSLPMEDLLFVCDLLLVFRRVYYRRRPGSYRQSREPLSSIKIFEMLKNVLTVAPRPDC